MSTHVSEVISNSSNVAKLASVAILASLLLYIKDHKDKESELPLPPGPPGHWLYGNDLPKAYAARAFAEMSKEYGPVFSLRRGSSIIVVICGQQAAIDIMEKENAYLVDRPRNIAAGEILSGDKRILLIRHGERFRKLRKALQSQLHSKIVEVYEPIQAHNAKNLILDVLDNPDAHLDHAKRYAASVIMTITYGKRTPTSYYDPEVQEVNKCLGRLGKAVQPGYYMVDYYPWLRFLPGYTTTLKQYHKEELALFRSQLDGVRAQMQRNEAQPCFAKYLIERQTELGLDDNELAYLAGSMFGAGSDTTAAAISTVLMAAALFPDAQRQVQDQLDSVVGYERMPSFGDMDLLTLVTAFYLETFRWRPVSVGGFAHRATKDIIYGSFRIPEGATVIPNHWALGRDANYYPEPDKFLPARWLTETGEINEKIKFFNFGFGRRVCPGQHVANRSVFINTAYLLWAFNISEDPSSPIDSLAFTDTGNAHPLPFRVRFEPRIPNLQELVENRLGASGAAYPFSNVATVAEAPAPVTDALREGRGLMAHLHKSLVAPEKRHMVDVLFHRRNPRRLLPGSVITVHTQQAPFSFSGVLLSCYSTGGRKIWKEDEKSKIILLATFTGENVFYFCWCSPLKFLYPLRQSHNSATHTLLGSANFEIKYNLRSDEQMFDECKICEISQPVPQLVLLNFILDKDEAKLPHHIRLGMPRPRSLRTLTLNQNATAVTPGPPSPTLSEATQASQMNFGTAGPEKIITRGDLKTSLQAYENLLGASASYRDALMHMSKATAGLADAMSACASLKGTSYQSGSRLLAASGLHHLMGNHWHVLSDSIDKQFERPLRQHLETYRTTVTERSASYEKVLREKSRIIRQTEMENMNLGRKKNRNLQTFREALEIMDHEEEVWDFVQGKVSLVVRSTLDVIDRITAKASDPVIEPMLQSIPDPFDSYGPPKSEDQIFSILAPLSIFNPSATPSPKTSAEEIDPTAPFASSPSGVSWTAQHEDMGDTNTWADVHSPIPSPPLSAKSTSTVTISRAVSPPSLRRNSYPTGSGSSPLSPSRSPPLGLTSSSSEVGAEPNTESVRGLLSTLASKTVKHIKDSSTDTLRPSDLDTNTNGGRLSHSFDPIWGSHETASSATLHDEVIKGEDSINGERTRAPDEYENNSNSPDTLREQPISSNISL
ncbi:cytochrome P450 [Pyrrhoderma noxium]|uniref:Cytochrome P450 n=1 Tax=Pyrrhoderma noxium TaxID=2282107 RepID=A0A286UMA1_9AGAM|nr:cytochrome P450 [Pyrrhoderma noxium]